MRTLEQYLRDNYPEIIDFAFRATPEDDGIHLVIHPDSKSGETIDILVRGNAIETLWDTTE